MTRTCSHRSSVRMWTTLTEGVEPGSKPVQRRAWTGPEKASVAAPFNARLSKEGVGRPVDVRLFPGGL